jgi:protein N-terminal amidase
VDSGADDGAENEDHDYDLHNVNYWAARLRPLWVKEGVEGGFVEDDDLQTMDKGEVGETVVVVCNRFGEENGMQFFYSFCLIGRLTSVCLLV